MGRLRDRYEIFVKTGETFQFQYGAIKSKAPTSISNSFCSFQFQYGAIKRLAEIAINTAKGIDFNSNMGRLRVSDGVSLSSLEIYFNSNMGRLRAQPN